MPFDPDNHVIKLCAQGMEKEGEGNAAEAVRLFQQAWDESTTDLEKFTAAHYVARHQENVADKLRWDQAALDFALEIKDDLIMAYYPSLYLNIAKCYEDLGERENARKNYEDALLYSGALPDDGYGKMIKAGIISGMGRVSAE